MIKYMNAFKNILTTRNILMALIFLCLIPLPLFNVPSIGLDPSWQISINLAIKQHLIFGKEYVFTYGPLGYLVTRLPIYTSKPLILLFQLFLILNAWYFIKYLLKEISSKAKIKTAQAFFLVIAFLVIGIPVFHSGDVLLYFYFTFYQLLFIRKRNMLFLALASVCAVLAFYIKVNVGIVVNLLFFIFMIYLMAANITGIGKGLMILLAHFAILYLASYILLTDFFLYIINSLNFISSYADAMFLRASPEKLSEGLITILLLLAPILVRIRNIITDRNELFTLFNLAAMIYITFKQGFVRADLADEHMVAFFNMSCFLAVLVFLFMENVKSKVNFYLYLIPIVLLSVAGMEIKTINKNIHFAGRQVKHLFDSSIKDKTLAEAVSRRKLPANIAGEIGDKTIDVINYEISYVYFNNLNYNPRPVIQSYSAYTPKLIDLNADKYSSASGPDYVLFHFASIDSRYFAWDDSKACLQVLRGYDIVDTIHIANSLPTILLKKTLAPKAITEHVVLDSVIHFNSKVTIPSSDNILFLTIDYNYTVAGKIRRFLFQPAPIMMNLYYETMDSSRFKLVMPAMKSGVPINKKINSFEDLYTYLSSKGKDNTKSTYFELTGHPFWMEDSFKIRITEYVMSK